MIKSWKRKVAYTGQKERLGNVAVTLKASAKPLESSEDGIVIANPPSWGRVFKFLYPAFMTCGLPLGSRCDLDEVGLFKPGQLPES